MNHKTAYGYHTKNGRLTSVTLDDGTAATYTYANGVLDSIVRSSLLPDGATKVSQKYGFTYDSYDNVTSVKVGNKTLVSYAYMAHNGPLKKITYGNGSTVEYGYDVLGRVITEKRDETLKYRYVYSSERDLSRKEEVDSSGKVIKATCYEYDSLDRLIRSWEEVLKSGALRREVLTEHTYDTSNRIKKQSWQTGDGTSRSETYTYNNKDGTLSRMKTASGREITLTYDYLKRLQSKTDGVRTVAYSYKNTGNTGTTTQVEKIAWSGMGTNDLAFGYTYDKLGNITKVTHNDQTNAEYTYNAQSQLLTAKLPQSNLEYTYSYDTGGNIRSIKENNNGTETTKSFSYTDSDWKDLLTAVDGHSLTYDDCGNPLTYYNGKDWTFTWKEGRRLAAAKSGTTSVSYTYDAEGMRTSKTINGVKHNYVYLGDLLVEETWGNNTLRFSYDEQNRPYSVQYNSNLYYYVLNQQGDVIRLVNGDGVIRGEYTYDAWGNILKVTATAEIGNVNPLRYRGYVYDSETGFYYVGSRYYDAENCRFINADSQLNGGEGIIGYNMFVYSNNNPVMYSDPTGHLPFLAITAAIGAAVGAVVGGVKAAKAGKSVWKGALKGAAVGGLVGLGIGVATGALLTGSAMASTAAVLGTASVKLGMAGSSAGIAASRVVDRVAKGYEKVSSTITGSTHVYRSVSTAELADITSSGKFNFVFGGMEAKQFAFSYGEALKFGSQSIINQKDIVAASVPNSVLGKFYLHNVDYGIFTGIMTVDYETIGLFNEVVSGTIKIMP